MKVIKDRIKQVRLHPNVNLSQEAFGKALGVTGAAISRVESGTRNASEQIIIGICREFNVSENWLRTGEGEPFVPVPTSALDALAAQYPTMTHETYVFVKKLVSLPKESQDVVMGFLREVVDEFGATASSAPKPSAVPTPGSLQQVSMPSPNLAEELAELRRQNQELAAEIAALKGDDGKPPVDDAWTLERAKEMLEKHWYAEKEARADTEASYSGKPDEMSGVG